MIAIVDYGMGNLRSVQKGFEKVGHPAEVTSDPARVADADKVVVPGVGAFADAMHELDERELIEPIRAAIDGGKPFLGICLGLQLLFTTSFEDGEHEGLDVIGGQVLRFPERAGLKVPHMGWNTLEVVRRPPLLEGIDDSAHFYFVHSYYVAPDDDRVTAARTTYGEPFTSVIWRDNLFACQFHPEKSQRDGLEVLRNFARL